MSVLPGGMETTRHGFITLNPVVVAEFSYPSDDYETLVEKIWKYIRAPTEVTLHAARKDLLQSLRPKEQTYIEVNWSTNQSYEVGTRRLREAALDRGKGRCPRNEGEDLMRRTAIELVEKQSKLDPRYKEVMAT